MKKIIIIFIFLFSFIITGCDGKSPIIATDEYCNDNPRDAICDGFNIEDTLDNQINALFTSVMADYNDGADEFACSAFFTDTNNILSECETNGSFFAPIEYTTITLIDYDDNGDLKYTLHTETNNIIDILDIDLTLVLEEDSLKISEWSYEVLQNPNLSNFEVIAYQFQSDYNDISIDACSLWLENQIDKSNCEMIRSSRLSSGIDFSFTSIQLGSYNIISYSIGVLDNNSSMEKYVILENGKLADGARIFKVTDIFNYGVYAYMNSFMNENYENSDICNILDVGTYDCNNIRDDIFEVGVDSFNPGILLSDLYLDDDLDYTFSFTISLLDGSSISIILTSKATGTESTFEDYDINFSEYK